MWTVEYTDEFEAWWDSLTEAEQEALEAAVVMLRARGPSLGRPFVDTIRESRFTNMKELRVSTIRVLFAFDPRRIAILLIGGDKRDKWSQWYDEFIPIADNLYEEHLAEIGSSTERRE